MNAWFDIACTCHNASDGHHRSNLLRTHFTQIRDVLLDHVSGNDHELVVAKKLRRDLVTDRQGVVRHRSALGSLSLLHLIHVELALLHKHIEGRKVLVLEVDSGLRHEFIDDVREQIGVSCGILLDSLQELGVLLGTNIL